jgi:hypothetical protein
MTIDIVLQAQFRLNSLSAEYVQCLCMENAGECRNSAVEVREYQNHLLTIIEEYGYLPNFCQK